MDITVDVEKLVRAEIAKNMKTRITNEVDHELKQRVRDLVSEEIDKWMMENDRDLRAKVDEVVRRGIDKQIEDMAKTMTFYWEY